MTLASTSSQAIKPHPKFAIGTEVFLLNSPTDRNASAGIPAFVVDDNCCTTATPARTFPASLAAISATSTPAHSSQRIYSITPTSLTFQAPESCLLSAEGAFKVGDVVKQKRAVFSAMITKRYVVGGKVRYDIRDELGVVVEGLGKDGEGEMNGLEKWHKGYSPVA